MSIIKAIKKCEYDFEVRAEKFLWHHPVLGFFSIFVGMPLIVLCAVLCDYNCFCFSNCHCFLDGSNLYCILNCGSNDLCHIKEKKDYDNAWKSCKRIIDRNYKQERMFMNSKNSLIT